MDIWSVTQYVIFLLVVTLLVRPVGIYLERVFTDQRTWLDRVLRPVEGGIYRAAGVNPHHEMDWKEYAISFVRFSLLGTLLLYASLRLQDVLPWAHEDNLSASLTPDLAMNTAISFATTTTWQAYAGETTMSYFSQVAGLAAQNFLAGAAGLAVGVAFIRGLAGVRISGLGNFWVDLVRATLWVLLPLSIVGSPFLVWQGVPLNFEPYLTLSTLEGGEQVIPRGPVAALEFIKNLGTNGGGFFNANGAHPFENPTPLTNFIEMLAIAVLPASLTHTFGRMVGRPRQGWVLYWVMVVVFTLGLIFCTWAEQSGNPRLEEASYGASSANVERAGNLEGKETRFGIAGSVLTAVTTSNGATGSYNSMHDSYTPLGGMVPLVNMLLGEVVFGGLGTGLYSMIVVVLLGLFLSGLMVGRTPEYLGKRLTPSDMKLIMLYSIVSPLVVLSLTAVAVTSSAGLAGLTTNDGIHGFSEILFAYSSSLANNGQNFAGLSANSPFYNLTTATAMLAGRFALAIVALALAGSLSARPRRPASTGTLPTDSGLFATVLVFVLFVVGALSYFPALALGPIVEHFLMV